MRRCAQLPQADEAAPDPIDDALLAVASLLLVRRDAPLYAAHQQARRDAEELHARHGAAGAATAAAALEALSLNVGVPRDMGRLPARALRSHARIVAGALNVCGEVGAASGTR